MPATKDVQPDVRRPPVRNRRHDRESCRSRVGSGTGRHQRTPDAPRGDLVRSRGRVQIAPLRAKGILDRAVGIVEAAGVRSTTEVDPASLPSSVVLDWAVERDLLAIGAPATSWFGGMFMGGVAVSAEGEFTTPMLVARTMPAEPRFASRILIASDGLAGSDALVDLGGRLARTQGASVVLVHAIGLESKARRRRVEEQASRLELDVDDPSQVRLEGGSARSMIVETASALGASLVVMGSRRLSGLRVIGSVSRRVVHQGHCSVLLVPPEL